MRKLNETKIIQRKITTGKCLSEAEQLEIFDFDDPVHWVRKYIKNYKLVSPAVEKKMVELRDMKLLNSYWHQYGVKNETLDFLFANKDVEVLKICIKRNILSLDFQIKLIETRSIELLKLYQQTWYFDPAAEEKLAEIGAKDMVLLYIKFHRLSQKAELKLVERNNPTLLTSYVTKYPLREEARKKMYEIAELKVMQAYAYNWVYPKAWNKN